jgi:heme A synthase
VRRSFFARLAIAAASVTYLLIVMGGIVRVTGSGLGCGLKNDWPLCNGGLLPPLQATAVIEFTHRWIAAVATALVVALTVAAWLTQRRDRRVVAASTLAALFFVLQVALGALTVKYRLPGGIVMIHLANALLLLGVLTYVAVTVSVPRAPWRATSGLPTTLSSAAAGATYVLVLSGALVVETGSSAACAGWPLCGGGFSLPAGGADTVNVVHRIVAGVVVLLVAVVMVALIRSRNEPLPVRRFAAVALAIAALQVAAGAIMVELRLPASAQAAHLALASALWASVLAVAVLRRAEALDTSVAQAAARIVDRRPVTPAGVSP